MSDALRDLCASFADAASSVRPKLAELTGGDRAEILHEMAAALRAQSGPIIQANAKDVEAGASLSSALRDRLTLDDGRIESMAQAVEQIAAQPDPVGLVVDGRTLANGVRLEKRRVPIGVILVIYESRPNVTSDAAALCLKAGNAILLKGGREAAHSNRAIVDAIRGPLEARGIGDAATFVDTTDRRAVELLVQMRGRIDLCVPRGGRGLIDAVTNAASIPVVKHDAGNCHLYIDAHLDGLDDTAIEIAMDGKTDRPGVCNAIETLLVHEAQAERLLPRLGAQLRSAGVELRADPAALAHLPGANAATEADWETEYLSLVLAVRVVPSLDAACAHIRQYGSQHTEAIVTSSVTSADRFVTLVDSANVMVNCSTRFADGGQYGLGAEIGISTDKLHARGPMGAEDLTTFQWILQGRGQTRGR
ncbi:MAG: glutamate-5-semialdehyde dehydrogenase [Planctomycetota bacterium]